MRTIPTWFSRCYTTTTLQHITGKDHSTSIYAHLRAAKHDAPKMRILLQGPSTEWSQIWKNLQNVPINSAIRSTCYRTDTWPYTDVDPPVSNPSPVLFWTYPLPHTRQPISSIHGMQRNYWHMVLEKGQTGHHPAHRLPLYPYHPATWLLCPNMSIWPSPKHEAILEVVDHMVYLVINHRTAITYFSFTDFMHRNRWRTYMWLKRVKYGNYLDVCR